MYCGKFKDVFPFIKNGANIKQDVNAGGIPITRIETLAGGEFNTSRLGYANIFDISPYYEYVLNSGDILMSHINSPAYLGRAVVFEDKYDIVIHGMNLLRLKANKELIDSRYAVYLFSGNIFKEHIRKITKKSVNQASFSINDLKEIEIQLPSIENQVIIAEKLDKLKMLIKKKNRLILFLDEMIKSRFVDLFGDIELNDKKWKKIKFGELIKSANNGLARRGNDKAGNIVLRLIELQENLINYSDPNRILLTDDEKKRYKLLEGDLLFARVNGNPKNVGRCATFYECEEQVYHNDHIIRTSCDNSQLDSVFAAYLFNSEYGKNKISRKIKTSAGQYTINQEGLKSIEIILPPIVIQYSFAEVVKQINKLKSDVQKSIDETQLLMDSLVQEYFG